MRLILVMRPTDLIWAQLLLDGLLSVREACSDRARPCSSVFRDNESRDQGYVSILGWHTGS